MQEDEMEQLKEVSLVNQMTIEEKFEMIDGIRVLHPRFNQVVKLIEDCHKSSRSTGDPECLLIMGPSGSGKSTLFNHYVEKVDKVIYEDTRTKKVLLWSEVPSPTTIKSVLEHLLDKLGDPFPFKGTVANKNHRLVNFIRDCGVELIMLDEFQHFIDPDKKKTILNVSDWFKSIVNITRVPVVLFGLEDSKLVLDDNPQLSRRFSITRSLQPFGYNTEREKEDFRMLLMRIENMLPFVNHTSLSSEDMADRFFYATKGLMDSVMKLVRRSAKIAIEKGDPRIELHHLSQALHLYTHINKDLKINPFEERNFSLSN